MFDSDTMLITDNEVMIRCAQKYYYTFKVPTMVIDSKKRKRKFTNTDKASLDIFCDNDNIGVIVNLSQEINTIMWDRINRKGDWEGAMQAYYDNCLLSILSGVAIDLTKKEYAIDCMEELRLVRERYNQRDKDGRAIRPKFFAHVAKKKGYYDPKKKCYKDHLAPMDFVQEVVRRHKKKKGFGGPGFRPMPIGDMFGQVSSSSCPRSGYVDLVLSMVRDMDTKTRMLYQADNDVVGAKEKRELSSMYFNRCIEGIKTMRLSPATMKDLLVAMDSPENMDMRRKLWSILFGSLGDELSAMLNSVKTSINIIEECPEGEDGDVDVFWLKFRYKKVS